MEEMRAKRKKEIQKKYRRTQSNKGLVRFELQVSRETKDLFDKIVKAIADEYHDPWDPRQRIAKARAQVFNEITQGVAHDFKFLNSQIEALRSEIEALSPSFFKKDLSDMPLPHTIASLPDDPEYLKKLLANTYKESVEAQRKVKKYKKLANQYEELYDAMSTYNETLKERLLRYGETIDP